MEVVCTLLYSNSTCTKDNTEFGKHSDRHAREMHYTPIMVLCKKKNK